MTGAVLVAAGVSVTTAPACGPGACQQPRGGLPTGYGCACSGLLLSAPPLRRTSRLRVHLARWLAFPSATGAKIVDYNM
jgi:hypothetical protein